MLDAHEAKERLLHLSAEDHPQIAGLHEQIGELRERLPLTATRRLRRAVVMRLGLLFITVRLLGGGQGQQSGQFLGGQFQAELQPAVVGSQGVAALDPVVGVGGQFLPALQQRLNFSPFLGGHSLSLRLEPYQVSPHPWVLQ
jgi:hypothetical protein